MILLTVAALASAALAATAFAAGKPAILFPGGTYLNQAATTGLSCLGGTQASTGTTTFVVSVPPSQSSQGVTMQMTYTFDPDDPALPSYSGNAVVQAHAPSVGIQAVPVAIPVTSDGGTTATVVNASVISIDSAATLTFDAASLAAWACGSEPAATGGATDPSTGCGGYTSLLAAVAGVKGDAPRRLMESQRECLKGRMNEARKKLDEFIKLIASPRTGLSDATVAGLINQALAIRNGLV